MSSINTFPHYGSIARPFALGLYPHSQIVLTTGLGLSARMPPLIPAVLAPGLNLLRDLKKEGRMAEYIIYQATDFIIQANRLNRERALKSSATAEKSLGAFVDKHFPDVASSVHVVMGDRCKIDSLRLQEMECRLSLMMQTGRGRNPMAMITAYGKSRRTTVDAFRYAAANILMNGGCEDIYPLRTFKDPKNTSLMLIGREVERPFFALTAAMISDQGNRYGSFSFCALPINECLPVDIVPARESARPVHPAQGVSAPLFEQAGL